MFDAANWIGRYWLDLVGLPPTGVAVLVEFDIHIGSLADVESGSLLHRPSSY